MIKIKSFLVAIFAMLSGLHVMAQLTVNNNGATLYNPTFLIENQFIGNGIELTNVNYEGDLRAISSFNRGTSDIGLENGIIISTGVVSEINQPSDEDATSGTTMGPLNDADVEKIASGDIFDLAYFEISFIPESDVLEFDYVFASEEYPQFVCSNANDVFGFFITGENPSGGQYNSHNIALVPDPADPSGNSFTNYPVSINTINGGVAGDQSDHNCEGASESLGFSQFYKDNIDNDHFIFDGLSVPLKSRIEVVPCTEYLIKIAIADIKDGSFNSAVFLNASSFSTNSMRIEELTNSNTNEIGEGCEPADIVFKFDEALEVDSIIDFRILTDPNVFQNLAELNTDYELSLNQILIPAGQSNTTLEVRTIEDGIEEGNENIYIEVSKGLCGLDTLHFVIVESPILDAEILVSDRNICLGESLVLDLNIDPDATNQSLARYENNLPTTIEYNSQGTISEIEVFLAEWDELVPGVINSVCIEDLTHDHIGDLEVYLRSPSGAVLELTTNNGGDGGNGTAADAYRSTCFVPNANQNINNGNAQNGPLFNGNENYMGEFTPEGDFNLFETTGGPVNGLWQIIIFDATDNGNTGTLNRVSLSLNNFYDIDYSWTPDDGTISCTDCQDPTVTPTMTESYMVEIEDSYGCVDMAQIQIEVTDNVEAPKNFTCSLEEIMGSVDFNITLAWDQVAGSTSYEIKVNEDQWQDVGLVTTTTFMGDILDFNYEFQLRAVNGMCLSSSVSTNCQSPSCDKPMLSPNLTHPSSSCQNDGQIQIAATGEAPFTFVLDENTQNTSGLFTNLAGGDYTINVTDNIGCSEEIDVSLIQEEALSISPVAYKDIVCHGSMDGMATFEVTGGSYPYTFQWLDDVMNVVSSDSIFNEGGAITYTYVVQDANGCTVSTTVSFTNPLELVIDPDVVVYEEKCNQPGEGSAVINVLGGEGSYIFIVNGEVYLQDSITGLSVGNYTTIVQDERGCQKTIDFSVGGGSAISLQADIMEPSCHGNMDGEIDIEVQGHNGDLSFIWENMSTDNPRTNLGIGTYFVTVTDEEQCSATASYVVSQPDPLVIEVDTLISISCFEQNDGSIRTIVSGGTEPYSFTWDNMSTNQHLTNIGKGEYCVIVTDNNGCTDRLCATVPDVGRIVIQALPQPTKCHGDSTGQVLTNIVNGRGELTYSWVGDNHTSDQSELVGVPSGEYTFTVTDEFGCSSSTTVIVEDAPIFEFTDTPIHVTCKGDNTGQILVEFSGGTDPIRYRWDGPDGYTAFDQDINGLYAGTYDLLVTDRHNCSQSYQVEVNEPEVGIEIEPFENDTICFGMSNGLLETTATGGAGGLEYRWNETMLGNRISDLPRGIYTLVVTDVNQCSASFTAEVVELDSLKINLSMETALCEDDASGIARVDQLFYGNHELDPNNFSYLWNSNPSQETREADMLFGGQEYSVLVEDLVHGCKNVASITIENPLPLEIQVESKKDPGCFLENSGEIAVSALNGALPITYEWGTNAMSSTDSLVTDLASGTYRVTATDANGCTDVTSITLLDPVLLQVSVVGFDVKCFGAEDGQAQAAPLGGSDTYFYNWSNGATTQTIRDLAPGTYVVSLTDGSGCEVVDSVIVSQPASDIDIELDVMSPICSDTDDGIISVMASGGNGDFQYSSDGVTYSNNPNLLSITGGEYDVYVRDGKGCISIEEDVFVEAPDPIFLDIGNDTTILSGGSVTIPNPTVFNAREIVSHHWSVDDDSYEIINNPNILGISLNGITNSITLTLEIVDAEGCIAVANRRILVSTNLLVTVPTGFTPDNSGFNDLLTVFGSPGIEINSFRVFDRNGEMLHRDGGFQTNIKTRGWDGTFRGKPMKPDVYVWYAKVTFPDGTKEVFRGQTQLIR